MNLKSKEMVYVISGSGKIVVEEEKINIKKGDLILINPEEKYLWKNNSP